ncbi:MAG: helix-turn-helix transcriptional regulator [Cyclobacteriaceae bacterium]|nr:helix-turn-helix transcriptional regulator [Cyclobacteriaceae bacterium]
MNLDLQLINLLIGLGALQGLIFGLILLFNRKHPGAVFLSIFMLTLAYNSFETFNWSSGLNLFVTDLFPFVSIYLLGPSLFLYLSSLQYPERKISTRYIFLIYALPIGQLFMRMLAVVYHVLWMNDYIQTELHPDYFNKIYFSYSEPLSVLVFIGFFVASVSYHRKQKLARPNRLLSKENQEKVIRWTKSLLIAMGILTILWPLTLIAPTIFDLPENEKYYPVELLLVSFIYWIAFAGYYQSRQIQLKTSRLSGVDEIEPEAEFIKLKNCMEQDKLFLDPELNLNKLAMQSGISSKVISSTLNQYHNSTFNDFVNGYRIAEAQSRLVDPAYQHLTISAIALECGFNSNATFQRVFKSKLNMTPKEYIAIQSKKVV